MSVKAVVLLLVLTLSVLPHPTAEAQVGAPDVNLTCSSNAASGSVEIEVHPTATLTGSATCIASNPNPYQEKIEVEVQADGLVTAYPGSFSLGPNAEVEFSVSVSADRMMTAQFRNLTVKVTVTEAMGAPPPNLAEKEVDLVVEIKQFSALQLEAVDSMITLQSKVDYNIEYKVYNKGNGMDMFLLKVTESYRSDLEEAGFTLVLPTVKVEIDAIPTPSKVRLQLRTPSSYAEWPINSEGFHEMSFTMEFTVTSEFSCKSEQSGCNSESIVTTITVYEEASVSEKILTGTNDSSQMLTYGGVGAGVILLLILFVVLRKRRE